ncbi:hypothetical protein [uncultured Cohaesibacter sp.]|uniref:hypothetical protein n=1 Tax=uncultured Cohaesibacter sp. TaxID=1002546 RepID=UPI002AAB2722|nr:hypothetical protein [uncultured Cohaesibacter sp.]
MPEHDLPNRTVSIIVTRSKKQEARSKKQEARSKKQEARSKKNAPAEQSLDQPDKE